MSKKNSSFWRNDTTNAPYTFHGAWMSLVWCSYFLQGALASTTDAQSVQVMIGKIAYLIKVSTDTHSNFGEIIKELSDGSCDATINSNPFTESDGIVEVSDYDNGLTIIRQKDTEYNADNTDCIKGLADSLSHSNALIIIIVFASLVCLSVTALYAYKYKRNYGSDASDLEKLDPESAETEEGKTRSDEGDDDSTKTPTRKFGRSFETY